MLSSLLQHPARYLAILVGLSALSMTFFARAEAPAGSNENGWLPNIAVMDNEELLESASLITDPEYPLSQATQSHRHMNGEWLSASLSEESAYDEGGEAVRELAKDALKIYWKSLVRQDTSLNVYTPVVEGHLKATNGKADYDVRLSGNTLKFEMAYAF